jgi:hypothetical protein
MLSRCGHAPKETLPGLEIGRAVNWKGNTMSFSLILALFTIDGTANEFVVTDNLTAIECEQLADELDNMLADSVGDGYEVYCAAPM